jgi:hypothetical protein
MICKGQFAASVSINMPSTDMVVATCVVFLERESRYFAVDTTYLYGVIVITIDTLIQGDCGVRKEQQQRSEASGVARRRHLEPGAGEGQRYKVPRQRVLRPARHRAGQVRDASTRNSRKCVRGQCDGGIRRVQADLLSDQGELRGRGDRRTGAQKAGSARSSQGAGPGVGVHPGAAGRWRTHSSTRAGQQDPEEIRSGCSPEDHRTSNRFKKNGAIAFGGGEGLDRPAGIVPQYELLRSAALGHALPPETRYGLLLFLCRGMWGWARAMAKPRVNVPQSPGRGAPLNPSAADEYRSVIHIFAAMAMNAEHRGATP